MRFFVFKAFRIAKPSGQQAVWRFVQMQKIAPPKSWAQALISATRTGSSKGYSNDSSKVTSVQQNQSSPNSATKSFKIDETATSSADCLPACPDPNLCCREGCPNCVWIEYAKDLKLQHKDSDQVVQEIEKKIDDPSIRAFIIMQVNSLKKKD